MLPVSAFVARREVMDVFSMPGSHGSTFGGNALAAAVGLEALNVIEEEEVSWNKAGRLARIWILSSAGDPLARALAAVRGLGLWAGAESSPAVRQRTRSL